ncbi:hypothetical protein D915_008724 [Fasciola hepatica]|uniref:G-protein coupled receptors family 1 profile domain-containing protein n=1 Tax=Fasciola hepatica TaxID=6192 RepID=A0A2H1BXJ0_FASHE|nr:hypothetical protein D915_008724 [Fasciola hepatica]
MSRTETTMSGGSIGSTQPKQRSLRASTQLMMAALALVDFCGQMISCLRYTILCLTQHDIRLLYTESFCRLQLFGEYCCQDGSAWFMCAITAERFWLMLRPTSGYSRNKNQLTPSVIALAASSLITIGKNVVLFMPSEDVCNQGYNHTAFFFADLVYKCLLPFLIIMVTSVGNLLLMHRQLVKMYASHMRIDKGFSIVKMTKKQRAELPPSTAAFWEVIFSCRVTIVSGAVFLVGALPINLFKLIDSEFENVLTARDICTLKDVIYNLINILYWTCVGLRFYLYIFSSPRVRNDMRLIIKIILLRLRCIRQISLDAAEATSNGAHSQTGTDTHTNEKK